MDIFRCIRGGLFLSITGVLPLQNSSGRSAQDKRGRPQGILKDQIQTALKEGRRDITYIQVCDMPNGINSIADILRKYRAVIIVSATLARDIARQIVRYCKQRRIKPLGGAVLGNLIRVRDKWPKR